MHFKLNGIQRATGGVIGSGNVFADLGLPDADTRLLKSRLVSKIDHEIVKRGLTHVEAGKIMGLPQREVLDLRNGRPEDYSVERLYRLLDNLRVCIVVGLE